MVSVAMFSQTKIIERVASRNAPKQTKITTLHQYKQNVHGPRPGTKICGSFAAKWMKPIQFWRGSICFVSLFTSTDRTRKQIQFENLNIASSLLEPQRTSRTIIGYTKQKQIEGTSSVPCDFHRNKNIPTSIRTCFLHENEIHARGVWSHLRKLPREKGIKVLMIKHERLHQFWTCVLERGGTKGRWGQIQEGQEEREIKRGEE